MEVRHHTCDHVAWEGLYKADIDRDSHNKPIHSHIHVVASTLQAVSHLFLNSTPFTEHSPVVGVHLVKPV